MEHGTLPPDETPKSLQPNPPAAALSPPQPVSTPAVPPAVVPLLSVAVGAFAAAFMVLKVMDDRIEKKVEDYTKSITKGEKGETGPIGKSVAVGTVAAWPLPEAPAGWLICNGDPKPRNGEYQALAELFENHGFPYGAGDGATTFNTPDFGDTSSAASAIPMAPIRTPTVRQDQSKVAPRQCRMFRSEHVRREVTPIRSLCIRTAIPKDRMP